MLFVGRDRNVFCTLRSSYVHVYIYEYVYIYIYIYIYICFNMYTCINICIYLTHFIVPKDRHVSSTLCLCLCPCPCPSPCPCWCACPCPCLCLWLCLCLCLCLFAEWKCFSIEVFLRKRWIKCGVPAMTTCGNMKSLATKFKCSGINIEIYMDGSWYVWWICKGVMAQSWHVWRIYQ